MALFLSYLAFIALGLHDALLGTAWPAIRVEFGSALEAAGYISMILFAAKVVSTLLTGRIVSRFGTGRSVAGSLFFIGAGLACGALATGFWMLLFSVIPLGFGGGLLDAALNNFVALRGKPRHMNWLHCFWGVGAALGTLSLSLCFRSGLGWRGGYWVQAGASLAVFLLYFVTLRSWRGEGVVTAQEKRPLTNRQVLALPHMKLALVSYLLVCALETTSTLWCSTYLTEARGLSVDGAALSVSLFFWAVTASRFLSGFLSVRISDDGLVRLGILVSLAGAALLLLPAPWTMVAVPVLGAGIGPVYPNLLHTTPRRFGEEASQSAIGLEMAMAYLGSTLIPPVFGKLAGWFSPALLPLFLLAVAALILLATERVRTTMEEESR